MAMKIAIYAVTKNRETTAKRWIESSAEADGHFVLDYGSHDDTPALLESHGVHVERKVPVSWDAARTRNEILARIPNDFHVCISLDLDEFLTPDWRRELENAWSFDTTRLAYLRVTDHSGDGDSPNKAMIQDRIHTRHGYSWRYAADEILVPDASIQEKKVRTERLQVRHLPIEDTSQIAEEKASYLLHLRDCIRAEPSEARYLFSLGSELLGQDHTAEAHFTLEAYLRSESSHASPPSRAAAYRGLAECSARQGESPDRIIQTLYRAALENPGDRDTWGFLALELAKYGNWPGCHAAVLNGLRSPTSPTDRPLEPAFSGGGLEALLRLSSKHLGLETI